MFGHMFGAIGVLAGNIGKLFRVPLSMRIHDGDAQIKQWAGCGTMPESHVVRMIREASQVAVHLGKSILLLDRYYLSVPGLKAWIEEEKSAGRPLLSLVMRAKGNLAAYNEPVPRPGRGRPRKKGEKIKVRDLFENRKDTTTCKGRSIRCMQRARKAGCSITFFRSFPVRKTSCWHTAVLSGTREVAHAEWIR